MLAAKVREVIKQVLVAEQGLKRQGHLVQIRFAFKEKCLVLRYVMILYSQKFLITIYLNTLLAKVRL